MLLSNIAADLRLPVTGGDAEITSVEYDSRKVRKGSLFCCMKGLVSDGHNFAAQAVEKGAAALIVEHLLPLDVPQVVAPDGRVAMAHAAAAFYNHPEREMIMLGVTGTNGKTSTTYMVKSIAEAAGKKVGLIGTIHNMIGDEMFETGRTTPESADLFALLRRMADERVDLVIMEVEEVVELGAIDPNPPGTVTFTVNGVTFTMVTVEGGTFTMGATAEQGSDAGSEEYPTHQVTLSSYSIGQTEVTQELWQAVMGSNPSYSQGNLQHPVEQVSWEDCQTFVAELNDLTGKTFRLPTEAEWEYAARGGNKSLGYKYAGSNDLNEVAWYWDGTSTTSTIQPVATKAPNELGIYDMSGNVYEWCQDSWGSYTGGAQTNPTGPTSGSLRVDRGGSYGHDGVRCRVSHRNYYHQTLKDGHLGLRLAL